MTLGFIIFIYALLKKVEVFGNQREEKNDSLVNFTHYCIVNLIFFIISLFGYGELSS
jgi:hypothetical protein